jgi:hypothetical protein
MSGLLRRIKRSRPADAGEAHPEGRAAETQGATTTAETAAEETRADSSEETTQVMAPAGESETGQQAAAVPAPKPRRWRPFGRRAKEIPAAAAVSPPPVLRADPNVPAGVDPAAAPMRPPAGRRGRLRRRLRYLRRARELMLRDLGGLLYEIHRTGGGNVEAHANVVGAKVQRIAGLDAEAHALETALAAPRADSVVFEPGVGGTCTTCGELHGSDAHFCANCGTPIGTVAEATETGQAVVAEPARRAFWRRAARPAATDESAGQAAEKPHDEAPADESARSDQGATDDATRVDAADEATRGEATDQSARDDAADETPRDDAPDETPRDDGPDETPRDDGPDETPRDDAVDETTRDDATDETGGDEPHNPHSSGRNGRPEERKAPGVSPGDPLVSRKRS